MASSKLTMSKCATCIKNSDEQKVKPGITLCEGCHQAFCLLHFVEHRQTLNNKLDNITEQRDVLRSRIAELPTRMSKEPLTVIDEWEKTMLQTVTEAASNARHQAHQSIISEMERECDELTSKITIFRDNDDYFETDLRELETKTEKLNEELNDLSILHRLQLNLPTLDCSNMVHMKPPDISILSEIAESNDCLILKPKKEYHSFIECFLTTHQPSTDITADLYGRTCASPTMLIDTDSYQVRRLVFFRQSMSNFEWKHGSILDIQWSFWLQQFIVLTNKNIVVVDAVEKQSEIVVVENHRELRYMNHWKHRCLVVDDYDRIFLHEMNKNLQSWFLLHCWSTDTTSAQNERITAIGLNERHIVLSKQCNKQYSFAVHKYDMTRCFNIQLAHSCTTIQSSPRNEWLLYDSSNSHYYVIDSELKVHEDPYLSSLKDFELTVSHDGMGRVFAVLISRQAVNRWEKQIKVYTNNCSL
jgi:hypothetical protein